MADPRLFRPAYSALPQAEREQLLRDICTSQPEFQLLRFAHFERWGQATDTAVYSRHSIEYVFVPGDTVTLGWDSFLPETTEADLGPSLDNAEVTTLNELTQFYRQYMSPVRTVTISPMLVQPPGGPWLG
jgi:hypothetical protein